MKKIGITFEAITDCQLEAIKNIASDYEVVKLRPRAEEIIDCEIVFGYMVPELLPQAKNLKWFHASFAGVDSLINEKVNFPEDVILTNSSGTYGIGMSEYLLTTLLMLFRKNMGYAKLQFSNTWKSLGHVKAVYGSTVCVVGLGDIGENFAKRCKALGASVTGVARNKRSELPENVDKMYTIDELDEAIKDADVVALCLPGTAETIGLFDHSRMMKMKEGAIILNVGRGSAIDTSALIELLESGQIGGAGLDVTDPEPLPSTSKLWQMENVIITPHISGGQNLDLTNNLIAEKFTTYLKDYLEGRPFQRVVDKKNGY